MNQPPGRWEYGKVACIVLLLSALQIFFLEPPAHADGVDDAVIAAMREQKLPGLALAVIKNGRVIKAKGYGFANVELKVPVSTATVFQSGSVGKQFTATAAMVLVEQGKLNLDEPISRYLDDTPPLWRSITVRHLLTHTSGIKDYESGGIAIDLRRDYTPAELVAKAAAMPLDFDPGTGWKYSNTGYVLLGFVIDRAAGRFYGDLLRERVFEPLGMRTTRVISDADLVPNRAAGYLLEGNALKNQQFVSPSFNRTADGSLHLTILDLVRWDAGLRNGKVLKPASMEAMWTPVRLDSGKSCPYGFGWRLDDTAGHRRVWHDGAWQGFTAAIHRYLDDRLTVTVLTNLAEGDPGAIARKVAGLYVPVLATSPVDTDAGC